MDRFVRFKLLRALWARARTLLAWLVMPYEREARLRAQRWQQTQMAERLIREEALRQTTDLRGRLHASRWQQIQTSERQLRDGIARGAGDPDSDVRPPAPDYPEAWALQMQAAQEAQRLAAEAWQRQVQQQHQNHQRR
jgi:hypothetical protein